MTTRGPGQRVQGFRPLLGKAGVCSSNASVRACNLRPCFIPG